MKEIPDITIQPFEEFHTTLEYDFDKKRNEYFEKKAIIDSKRDNTRVYVALTREVQLVGFFTLSMKSKYFELFETEQSWSATLLGQLGVNKPFQGRGIGSYLVSDAIRKVKKANEIVGCVGILVDVIGSNLVDRFYKKLGFVVIEHKEKVDRYILFYHIRRNEES